MSTSKGNEHPSSVLTRLALEIFRPLSSLLTECNLDRTEHRHYDWDSDRY